MIRVGRLKPRQSLELQLKASEIVPPWVDELAFAKPRRWRFDLAWPDYLIAVEVDGGKFSRPVTCHRCGAKVKHRLKSGKFAPVRLGGRHHSAKGAARDNEKLNAAARLGWRVFRFDGDAIAKGDAIRMLESLEWSKKCI